MCVGLFLELTHKNIVALTTETGIFLTPKGGSGSRKAEDGGLAESVLNPDCYKISSGVATRT